MLIVWEKPLPKFKLELGLSERDIRCQRLTELWRVGPRLIMAWMADRWGRWPAGGVFVDPSRDESSIIIPRTFSRFFVDPSHFTHPLLTKHNSGRSSRRISDSHPPVYTAVLLPASGNPGSLLVCADHLLQMSRTTAQILSPS